MLFLLQSGLSDTTLFYLETISAIRWLNIRYERLVNYLDIKFSQKIKFLAWCSVTFRNQVSIRRTMNNDCLRQWRLNCRKIQHIKTLVLQLSKVCWFKNDYRNQNQITELTEEVRVTKEKRHLTPVTIEIVRLYNIELLQYHTKLLIKHARLS